jgi:hypothetical protein
VQMQSDNSEMAEVEDNYASALETSRQTLKQIRNTESSVHPTRENKTKITDQIAHLKHKDPTSPKIMTLEQELVRAEAENLVAEAQLTNITRQKLKEAYGQQINAVVERSEKQHILAGHARRLLDLLDDSPVVPGAERATYDNERAAKEILLDAEEELGKWQPDQDASITTSQLDNNLLPPLQHSNSIGNGEANVGRGTSIGAGTSIQQSDSHSMTGAGDERGRKLETQQEDTNAYSYDPKVLESAT